MMKRIATVCLSVLTGILCLTGCSRNAPEKKDGLSVVATIYPEYDWVLNIMGEKAEDANVKLLLDNGSDMHSFQPSIADIALIQNSDLFIYVGGESDDWVEGVLEGKQNEDMIVINLLEVLGDRVKTEEIIEGMEQEEEHDADGEGQHHHEAQEESDEHVWLSLKNAVVCCDAIAEGLVTADGANADVYRTNLAAYRERLNALDEEYKKAVDAASGDTLLFGDRFPFRYLADDYLVFGKETRGLPENLLRRVYPNCIRIPMREEARSLNLSNAVAIVLYEALRQQGFPSLCDTGALTGRDEADGPWLDYV